MSDTGIGISSDALTYIFDEFRQVDDRLARSYGGTGLGLAITRKIVELLEGEISVTSEPEGGQPFPHHMAAKSAPAYGHGFARGKDCARAGRGRGVRAPPHTRQRKVKLKKSRRGTFPPSKGSKGFILRARGVCS